MANVKNLKPKDKNQNREEAKKNGRKGGIASGKARRQKKQLHELTRAMMDSETGEKQRAQLLRQFPDLEEGDATVAAGIVAGQIKAAMGGSTKAFLALNELHDKGTEEEEGPKYTLPITDITTDFVETYRDAHRAFEDGSLREIICKGGRGSIKSNFWSAMAEETILQDPQAHVIFTRRYKSDLRYSVYSQFEKTLRRHGTLDDWTLTTSPMEATYKATGQKVAFIGCDKPISSKSATLPFGYVKLLIHEEANEMAGVEQMDQVEDTFLRSDTPALDVKIYNPPKSVNNFMNKYAEDCMHKEGTKVYHSYYYNVPVEWLGQRFFDRAEQFKRDNPTYYANNYLGEVTGTGGLIFHNIEERTITDEELQSFGDYHYGLDFGYIHPQVFIMSHYDYETDTVYVLYEVFREQCRNATFAKLIEEYKDVEIICDSARPDNIADMREWGFDAIGARKRWEKKGRSYSWEWMQQARKIVIDPDRAPAAAKEMKGLEMELLPDGTFSSAYPDKGEDCTMALIYSLNRVIIAHEREMD